MQDILFVIGAYLVGSLPQLYLLARLGGYDTEGDLHMNLWRQGGRLFAAIGLAFDFAKGIIVILVGRTLEMDTAVIALGGLAVVSGQMWPVFFRFDGEKGNTTGLAMVATQTPGAFLVALTPVVIALVIRTVPRLLNSEPAIGGRPSLSLPLGVAIAFTVLPLAAWIMGEASVVSWSYVGLLCLIMLRRVTAGLTADLNDGGSKTGIFINRVLYDRSRI
jgi:glycerol-3-phosphate acyltransferase PlsY